MLVNPALITYLLCDKINWRVSLLAILRWLTAQLAYLIQLRVQEKIKQLCECKIYFSNEMHDVFCRKIILPAEPSHSVIWPLNIIIEKYTQSSLLSFQ